MGHVLGATLAAIYADVTAGIIGALAPLGSQARLRELVLAVPVASLDTIEKLNPEVDAIVCLKTPEDLGAIGYFYRDFHQVSVLRPVR
jgi:predicted phosphoribosyltransferase